jgi:primosomal protein N' (replication factor Y)
MDGWVAEVAVAAPLEKALSYRVDTALADILRVGMRVKVPLGRRTAIGYVLKLGPGEADGLKALLEVPDAEPLFPEVMAEFFRRAADYYQYPLGEVIRTALPAGLSGDNGVKALAESVYRAAEHAFEPRGPRQRELLAHLRRVGCASRSEILTLFPGCHASLRTLVARGALIEEQRERLRDPFADLAPAADVPVDMTAPQARAFGAIDDALQRGGFHPMLLHGVTGSGKTEVYLRAIEKVLLAGRQALVLVPEIALTPQLVSRFRARFAGGRASLAVLHSGLSAGERYDAWRSVARGDVDIVIGARSAVFAPLVRPGMIIVDEEHESSYKQGDGFRYHARDLALMRGQMEGIPVLLGSATPALTTFQRARQGKLDYLALPERVLSRPLPAVELIDLTQERPTGTLSQPLQEALIANLERGEQSLLLLNRRGFAPYLLCADCGEALRCPHCDITLTYYLAQKELRCNYCDFHRSPPDECPSCRGAALMPEGAGTERLEQELREILPSARIARMDRDTTGRKGAHQSLVTAMEERAVDVLVGTQMVAKGLDFPGVTLVGVVQADNLLNLPDFRAAERAFTLLTQVAGRAGRGERPGRVFVQTYAPEHFALLRCVNHDYEGFAGEELQLREELGYPPFGFLVNCVFAGADRHRVEAAAESLVAELLEPAGRLGVEVLGPAPCPLARLRNKSRYQVLLKSAERPPLRHLLTRLPGLRRGVPRTVTLTVDIDPLDML